MEIKYEYDGLLGIDLGLRNPIFGWFCRWQNPPSRRYSREKKLNVLRLGTASSEKNPRQTKWVVGNTTKYAINGTEINSDLTEFGI